MLKFSLALIVLIYLLNINQETTCEEEENFYVQSPKNLASHLSKRNNRNNNSDEFEKFFLKASKSVPRIGRRGPPVMKYATDYRPYPYMHPQQQMDELQKPKYPVWSEIAERFEYDPELLSTPGLLSQLEQAMGDDPTVNDWDKIRLERTSS